GMPESSQFEARGTGRIGSRCSRMWVLPWLLTCGMAALVVQRAESSLELGLPIEDRLTALRSLRSSNGLSSTLVCVHLREAHTCCAIPWLPKCCAVTPLWVRSDRSCAIANRAPRRSMPRLTSMPCAHWRSLGREVTHESVASSTRGIPFRAPRPRIHAVRLCSRAAAVRGVRRGARSLRHHYRASVGLGSRTAQSRPRAMGEAARNGATLCPVLQLFPATHYRPTTAVA